MSSYGEHEEYNDFIQVMSAMALSKASKLTDNIYDKGSIIVSANEMALRAGKGYSDYCKKYPNACK
jgi:hypothetical protein